MVAYFQFSLIIRTLHLSLPGSPSTHVIMNHSTRVMGKLAAACLGLASSLLLLVATPVFSSPAQASGAFHLSPSYLPLATTAGRVQAGAKDVEGKTQESIGKVTGNKGDRLAGKAKQAEAKVRNTVEDVKDKGGKG